MYLSTTLTRRIIQCSLNLPRYTTMAGPIEFDEIKAGLENKSLIYLDVRNKSELQNDGQIVGSVNLPLPEIIEAFGGSDDVFKSNYGFNKPDKNSGVIVVGCLGGKRALAAEEHLKALGFNNLRIYPGSFTEWKAKGGPIFKP